MAWLTGCRPPTDGENGNANGSDNQNINLNDNTAPVENQNDNEDQPTCTPGFAEICVEVDPAATATEPLARALSGSGTEFGFYGTTESDGTVSSLLQVDTILPANVALLQGEVIVRMSLDETQRPVSFFASDGSGLFLDYSTDGSEVTTVFVSSSGETTRQTTSLEDSSSATQVDTNFDPCDLLGSAFEVTDAILADCTSEDERCTGSVAQAIAELKTFCTFTVVVAEGILADDVGSGGALSEPLRVTANKDQIAVNPGTGVSITALAFGGAGSCLFNWSVVEGPAEPLVTPVSIGCQSTGGVTPGIEGDYVIRVLVIDANGNTAYFDVDLIVAEEVGVLAVTVTSEVSEDNFLVYTLTAEVSGGVADFSYEWTLVAGPADAEIESPDAETTQVTFADVGNHILQIQVTDALGDIAISSEAITVVDPATSLLAEITFDPCPSEFNTARDTCLEEDDSMTLGVALTRSGQPVDTTNFQYVWSIEGEEGVFAETTDRSSPTPTVVAETRGTFTVQLAVTDPQSSETATDEIDIEVVSGEEFAVDIISDKAAILNQPETLIGTVTGSEGQLTYLWSLEEEGTGTFDDDDAQSVQFTPTLLGTVTVNLTVTDDATGKTAAATATITVATFTVTIAGPGIEVEGSEEQPLQSNQSPLPSYTADLSEEAPESVTYSWTAEVGADESLSVTLTDDDSASVDVLVVGNGVFTLKVEVTDASDIDNKAVNEKDVTVECADADQPTADAGMAQLVSADEPAVDLKCVDLDSTSGATFFWKKVSGEDVDIIDPDDEDHATFAMPASASMSDFEPLVLECEIFNPATLCTDTDTTTIYAEPIVEPEEDSKTVLIGRGQVTLHCDQISGSAATGYTWVQLDQSGDVENFKVDSDGVLTFTAPTEPRELEFKCQGTIGDPGGAGNLGGPLSIDSAVVKVVGFLIETIAQTNDAAPSGPGNPGGQFDEITIGRVRLNNQDPGYVVFDSTLTGSSITEGLFGVDLIDLDQIDTLVLQGGTSPCVVTNPACACGEYDSQSGGSVFKAFDVNDSRVVAFATELSGATCNSETEGIYLREQPSGVFISELAVNGKNAPDLNPSGKVYCEFSDVAVAGDRTTTFIASFDNNDTDCADDGNLLQGVYSHLGSTTLTVARADTTNIPNGGALFDSFFAHLDANEDEELIFSGGAGADESSLDRAGAFIQNAALDDVFLDGNTAPNTSGGTFDLALPKDLALASDGTIAFHAAVTGSPLTLTVTEGIFTKAGSTTTGRVLNVDNCSVSIGVDDIRKLDINAAGDMVFIAKDCDDAQDDEALFYYVATSGTVVLVHDQANTPMPVRVGETITIEDAGSTQYLIVALGDVQINDAGRVVFTIEHSGGTAVLVARPALD